MYHISYKCLKIIWKFCKLRTMLYIHIRKWSSLNNSTQIFLSKYTSQYEAGFHLIYVNITARNSIKHIFGVSFVGICFNVSIQIDWAIIISCVYTWSPVHRRRSVYFSCLRYVFMLPHNIDKPKIIWNSIKKGTNTKPIAKL